MIARNPVRKAVRKILREQILDGTLRPGTRLSEPEVAAELGVSRTPLREALLQLESEGLVGCELGKGFAVRPLSVTEHNDLYPILANLQAMALRLGGRPTPKVSVSLHRLNQQIRESTGNSRRLFALDRRWHELLLAHCPNRQLLVMVARLNSQARRYDLAFWREVGDVCISHEQHGEILGALEQPKLNRAIELLETHWLSGMEPVARWLEQSISGGVKANRR